MKCFKCTSMTSLPPDSELCNFITFGELMKAPQNFAQGSFSIKSLKIFHKNRGEFLASGPLILGNFGVIRLSLSLV